MCKKDAKVNSKNKTKGESNTKDRNIFTDPPVTMCSINITNYNEGAGAILRRVHLPIFYLNKNLENNSYAIVIQSFP